MTGKGTQVWKNHPFSGSVAAGFVQYSIRGGEDWSETELEI